MFLILGKGALLAHPGFLSRLHTDVVTEERVEGCVNQSPVIFTLTAIVSSSVFHPGNLDCSDLQYTDLWQLYSLHFFSSDTFQLNGGVLYVLLVRLEWLYKD